MKRLVIYTIIFINIKHIRISCPGSCTAQKGTRISAVTRSVTEKSPVISRDLSFFYRNNIVNIK